MADRKRGRVHQLTAAVSLLLLGSLTWGGGAACGSRPPPRPLAKLPFIGSYFEIPRPAAVNALTSARRWEGEPMAGYTRARLVDEGVAGLQLWGLGPRSRWDPRHEGTAPQSQFLAILHLSDAQVRDTAILRRSDFEISDLVLPSTTRLELIEDLDSLLLAALLRGFRTATKALVDEHPDAVLAVHTGDLTDISLVTEMIDATAAVRYGCHGPQLPEGHALPSLPFVSVPGNHDGLTFGVIEDWRTMTWELGMNRLEFHLASLELLEDVRPSACAARNEAVEAVLRGVIPHLEGAPTFSKRLEEREERRMPMDPEAADVLRTTPVALKGRISTPREEDGALQPGYFSLVRRGFRIVVLDTRSKQTHDGAVGPVQVGWLYRELAESLAARQPVLVFAHHHPSEFSSSGPFSLSRSADRSVMRMLTSFPHVIGYFYGHSHKLKAAAENGVAFVQAPSIVDFPMGGLALRVERRGHGEAFDLTVEHVMVAPDRSKGEGVVLAGLQDEALIYAWHDAGEKASLDYDELGPEPEEDWTHSRRIRWSRGAPAPRELLGSNGAVKRISRARSRLLGEEAGAWHAPVTEGGSACPGMLSDPTVLYGR